MSWAKSLIADDGTHHVLQGRPMYPSRFVRVQKFHAPGLAPARDESGAFHIDAEGHAIYPHRFLQTWGFYEGLAAVEDTGGWGHIRPDGTQLGFERFGWCGNFQERRCAVRTASGAYLHITDTGTPAYPDRHAYAGDFRDGVAVARFASNGLCTHIDAGGRMKHGKWFLDLDIYHKGFARARDRSGWFHVDTAGRDVTAARYSEVEPFYNGQARVLTLDGRYAVIDESGTELAEVGSIDHDLFMQLSADLVGHWKTDTITAAVRLGVFDKLPASAVTLGDSTGTPADSVERLLGALWELSLVTRDDCGIWRRTRRGDLLCSSAVPGLSDASLEYGGPLRDRWSHLLTALRKGERHPPDVFEEAHRSSDREPGLHRMLANYATHDYLGLVKQLPLSRANTIVDAGGGTGVLAGEISLAFPSAAVSVMDRPEVCTLGEAAPPSARVRFIPGDLFAPWPITADAVVLARVLHDWSDDDAHKILHNARRALPTSGLCIVIEMLLDDRHPFGRLCDLHMMAVTGGRERTEQEFETLLATNSFRLLHRDSTRSVVGVLVAEAV